MSRFTHRHGWFFYPYFFLAKFLIAHLLFYEKGDLIIYLDTHHKKIFDLIFPYITNIGDGVTVALIMLVLLFTKTRWFLGALFGVIIIVICIKLGKEMFFHGWPRPRTFLEDNFGYKIRIIEGLNAHRHNSMPSGHTAAAFFIFSYLAFISEKKAYGFVCFLLAFIVGFSRMYLAQHFPEDVFVGSVIGILSAVAGYQLFCVKPWLDNKPWANKPLINT